jgi:hypothetical protein
MKNVHLIPTDNPSRLGRVVDTGNLFLKVQNDLPRGENVNVYITVDDTIKIGDREIIDNECRKLKFTKNETRIGKKVILCTDPILIQSGVQEISNDFLEWLVQNPSCERVEVELFPKYSNNLYGIIIPKEEPKQEQNTISFVQDNAGREILKLCENGDIFIKGKLAENDKEVVDALREFLKGECFLK